MNPLFSCFVIDLKKFEELEDVQAFLTSCGIQDKVCQYKLWRLKRGLEIKDKVTKVWIDKFTFSIIAYSTHNSQNFTKEYIDFLQKIEPIKEGEIIEVAVEDEKTELTVDCLLDKIRISGINSLSKREKDFLDSV